MNKTITSQTLFNSFITSELKDEPLEKKIANNKGKRRCCPSELMEKRQKQQRQFVNEIFANSIENGNNQFAVNLLFF